MNKKLEGKLNKAKVLFKEGTDMTIDDNRALIGACLIAGLALVQTKNVPKAIVAGGTFIGAQLLLNGIGMVGLGALFGELSENEED